MPKLIIIEALPARLKSEALFVIAGSLCHKQSKFLKGRLFDSNPIL